MGLLNIVTIPPNYHKQIEDGLRSNKNFECEIFGEKISVVLTDKHTSLATIKYTKENWKRERTVSRDLQSVLSAIESFFQSKIADLSKHDRIYLITEYNDEDDLTDAEIVDVIDVALALFNCGLLKSKKEYIKEHATNSTLFSYSPTNKDGLLKVYYFVKGVPVQLSWSVIHVNGTSVLLLKRDNVLIDYCTLYDLSFFLNPWKELNE